ncbi:MAG TPA: hypothetical protein VIL84_00035 [Devosiaceae bacterium]
MQDILGFIDDNATDILFNVAAVTVFFTIARLVRIKAPIALVFAFAPLALAWAYQDANTRAMLFSLIGR